MPLSGHTVNKFRKPAVLKVNMEGLAASKMNVLHHLAVQYQALVILLQKSHCTRADKLTIPGFTLAGSSLSRKHGLAMFVHDRPKRTLVGQYPATSDAEWLCVDVDGYIIVNVYKPAPTRLQASDLPVFPHPVLYAGDFDCPHVNWGYRTSSADGECLFAWSSLNGILEMFPRSQHRPSFIVPPRLALPVPSKPVERWNFSKVNWSHYKALTKKLAKSLLPPDSPDVDQAFAVSLDACVPHHRRTCLLSQASSQLSSAD